MFKRLTRIGSSLAVVSIAFGIYTLTVVPLIEPNVRASGSSNVTDEQWKQGKQRVHRHSELLDDLFPPGAWERQGPKVLESEQAMLLLNEHRQMDEHRLELVQCTLILFPRPPERSGGAPQGRPIVLRAKEGAELTFDGPIDLLGGKIGRLTGGRLRGEVVIFRRESVPGARDDVEVVTSNVQLDEQRVQTPHAVRFQFGRSYGSGRDMIILLLPSEGPTSKHGPAIGGIRSLELVHVDKVHLHLPGRGLLPGLERKSKDRSGTVGAEPQDATPNAADGQSASTDAPIEVACDGPFFFDVVNKLARFEEHVDVLRLNPDGPSDQLNCELLEIKFSERTEGGQGPGKALASGAPPPETRHGAMSGAKRQLPALQPDQITASGHPVIVRSPSNDAWAQAETLAYNVATRQLRLEGENAVVLRHGTNEVQAPAVQYQPLPNTQLGRVWASGPGHFRGTLRPEDSETLHARWQNQLHLRPHEEQHVLSLHGAASVEFTEAGAIAADEIHLWLKEADKPRLAEEKAASEAKAVPGRRQGAAIKGQSWAGSERILPQRMQATGNVKIGSARLTGQTNQLEVWFKEQRPTGAAAARSGRSRSKAAPGARDGSPPAGTRSTDPRQPGRGSSEDRLLSQDSAQRFDITSDLLRVELVRSGQTQSVKNVTAIGQVRLLETQTAEPDELPLEVTGRQIEVLGASGPAAKVAVQGAPARIQGRGISVVGGNIQLHRGQNRLQIKGPGKMQLPIDRDLDGKLLARPQALDVTWKDGMDFDGRTARFVGKVSAVSDSQQALAETMDVSLSKQLDFGRRPQRDKVDIREIQLDGGVWLENRTIEQGQLMSIDRLQVRNLSVDRHTGKVLADGPGWFVTVRDGETLKAAGAASVPAESLRGGPDARTPGGRLTYLRADFIRGITGNLHQGELRFEEQVRTIYGPVDDWRETIDVDSPQGLDEHDVLLNCDTLRLAQIGSGRDGRKPVEVTALGNTVVESQRFWSRSHRITYVQAKDLLILEGDGRADAQLWRQQQVGGPRTRAAARKILYWRGTNQIEIDDARYFDWTRSGGAVPR